MGGEWNPILFLDYRRHPMDDGAATMARPRKKAEPRPTDGRAAIVQIKGTTAYADWLERFHQETHIPKTTLFRLGIALLAKQHGFEEPPEM
jgi:hypothetical protein